MVLATDTRDPSQAVSKAMILARRALVASVLSAIAVFLVSDQTRPAILAWIGSTVIPRSPEEFWLAITAIVTFGLVIQAGRGLHSLAIAKKDMTTRALREALGCSVQRSLELAQDLLPAMGAIRDKLQAGGIPQFLKSADEVDFDIDSARDRKKDLDDWFSKVPVDAWGDLVDLANRVEAWAMYFILGLADIECAAPPCAGVYCVLIAQLYPVIMRARFKDTVGHYPHAVKLFDHWIGARKDAHFEERRQSLLRELNELYYRKGTKNYPKPIGLD